MISTKLNKAPVPARAQLGPQDRKRRGEIERKPYQANDTSWQAEGACRMEGVDPAWFYPEKTQSRFILRARDVCDGCPVRDKCLLFALETDPSNDWGVWGGTTKEQRIPMRRRLREAKAA